MKVQGVEITQEQQDAAYAAQDKNFLMRWVKQSLVVHGVPVKVSERAADRCCQKWRKAGLIEFDWGMWRKVEQ